MRVLGYVRVSTSEQASSGAGLEAQRRAIIAECERRGWHLVETIEDAGYSARDLRRPGIQEALRALEAGEASALVVAKLDRLSRSMLDFSKLMAKATQRALGARRARCRRRYLDAERRGDGEHARDVRAVRAPADLAAHEGGAGGEARAGRQARAVRRRCRRRWCGGSSGNGRVVTRCGGSPRT